MGLFGFGKKKWDEERSDANKARMRELFESVMEGDNDYKLAYGFSLDVNRGVMKVKYKYGSLIVGYRERDMSIVLIETTPKLEGCGEPEIFKREDIKKVKIVMGGYTLYRQGGMMAGYRQFSILEDNDEDYLVYCHQPEEEKDFSAFFKTYSKKK